jgi:hypothetical protein
MSNYTEESSWSVSHQKIPEVLCSPNVCYCVQNNPPLKPKSSSHPYILVVPHGNTTDLQAGDAQFKI